MPFEFSRGWSAAQMKPAAYFTALVPQIIIKIAHYDYEHQLVSLFMIVSEE